mgnify:CR=1 FL=1|tara:strand:- start:107 stop:694 length:588 start_codon:yes stop_codon:yes gene_type:complete
MRIILASGSPRRKKLLKQLNCNFNIIIPSVDESLIKTDIKPEEYCTNLATKKAHEISQNNPNALIIGADTIVTLENEILEKPNNKLDAINMLSFLSSKTHKVLTGVCLIWPIKKIKHVFFETTFVSFKALDKREIEYYVNNYTPYDKAGSYGIQDWSAIFVNEIKGCYNNVVGFPLSRFYIELKNLNINLLEKKS